MEFYERSEVFHCQDERMLAYETKRLISELSTIWIDWPQTGLSRFDVKTNDCALKNAFLQNSMQANQRIQCWSRIESWWIIMNRNWKGSNESSMLLISSMWRWKPTIKLFEEFRGCLIWHDLICINY